MISGSFDVVDRSSRVETELTLNLLQCLFDLNGCGNLFGTKPCKDLFCLKGEIKICNLSKEEKHETD